MTARKQDAEKIEFFVATLAETLELDSARAWWPEYLFHTTEVLNAINILESEQLLSREDVGDDMRWENANRGIIGQTPEDIRHMARFYFRPRTPMTHNNEGFRTLVNRHPHAYCPFPVMLIFRSAPILTLEGTAFSNGNCSARETTVGTTADFLEMLPFADIYHDSAWAQGEEGRRIRHHRQAEVLVPSPFLFGATRPHVRVRSVAERETLLSLLSAETLARYRGRIQVSSKQRLFYKQWTYIESVALVRNRLTIRFNESTEDTNEFSIRLQFFALDGAPISERMGRGATIEPLTLTLPGGDLSERPFRLEIEIEGALAYRGVLDPRTQVML